MCGGGMLADEVRCIALGGSGGGTLCLTSGFGSVAATASALRLSSEAGCRRALDPASSIPDLTGRTSDCRIKLQF